VVLVAEVRADRARQDLAAPSLLAAPGLVAARDLARLLALQLAPARQAAATTPLPSIVSDGNAALTWTWPVENLFLTTVTLPSAMTSPSLASVIASSPEMPSPLV
jgi:hypothetical protein